MAQSTFNITVGTDDGEVDRSGAAYPPVTTGPTVSTIAAGIDARKRIIDGTYANKVVVLRFDTSSLPDDTTVTGATLRVYIGPVTNNNSRNLNCEWLADGAISTGDYADLVGTTGFSVALSSLTTSALNDLVLTTPTNVNKTGYTKIRLGISGGAPTGSPNGTNEVPIAALEDATNPEPSLIVDYTAPVPNLRTVRSNLRLA